MACYRFGRFFLDPASRILLCDEQPVNITAKVFETLVLLVENHGRVLIKDEMLAALWQKTTVEEANLAQNISTLRRALEDNPKEHRYIATIAGRGYMFVAAVTEVPQSEKERSNDHLPAPLNPASSARYASRIVSLYMIPGLVAIPVICLAAFLLSRSNLKSPKFYSSIPLTSFVGSEICPSFAPDGERVAFAWNGESQDNFDIYVKQIGDGTLLRLTNHVGPDVSPAWSPDGRTIAFLRLISDDKADLLLIPSVAAGPTRTLAEVTAPLSAFPNHRFIAWSPDGKWIAVSDSLSFGGVMGLFLVSVESGEKRRLTQPTAEFDDYEPSFSPDARHIAFVRYQGAGFAQSELYVLDLSMEMQPQEPPRRITFYNRHTGSPVWTSDGRAILFTRSELVGNHSVWRINLAGGGKSEPVLLSAESSSSLDISRRGDRLAYARESLSKDIWAMVLPSLKGKRKQSGIPVRWIGSTLDADEPQFSPDGQRIAFQSDRSGENEIWICNRDGSHLRQLTHMGAFTVGFPRWSPDGKKIVFHSRPQGKAMLYLVNAEGGSPELLGAEEGDDYAPSWSHDGKWIYFTSRQTGDIQVWKMPAGGGPRMQITKNSGWSPFESVDGKYLFYIKLPHYSLWKLPLRGGNESEVLPSVAGGFGSAYAVGREGIYFIRDVALGAGQELAFSAFANGKSKSIVRITHPVGFGLAVSPDESLILYSQANQIGSDLVLVEKFH